MTSNSQRQSIGIVLFDGDEEVRAWVRSVHERARLTTSVCTGALVLADAGLLKGRRATIDWSDFDELLGVDGSIEARPEARFADEGDISPRRESRPGSTWPST